MKKVFKVQDSSAVGQESQKVSFFPGFEAFTLPSPTVDPEALKSITVNKSLINPLFISGLEDFRSLVRRILLPKNSVNDGELVTGEGLAVLVQLYVQAINTPGMVPNVQNAWDQFVEVKCSDAMKDALNAYDTTMSLQLKDKLPCDNDRLRNGHGMALENSEAHFMADTAGISTNTIETFLKNLKESLSERFHLWQEKNAKMTREFCNNLLAMLKKQHLDPVIQQLQRKEGAKLSFHEIIGKYNLIKDDYHKSAIGAKDEIEAVFFEFHPALMKEQEQYMSLLQQLKDYDERLTEELAANAFQEQEKQKLEEQQQRLLQENRQVKREMEMLSERQNEERKKFREQMDNDLRVQIDQMKNMMDANMQQAQREREQFLQENQQLRNQFLDMQKMNEENIKMIKKLSKLVERQEEEKRREEERMERTQAAMEKKEKFEQMEARHREEKESLRREMEEKLEQQRQALTEEYRKAAQSRMQMVEEIGKKLEDVEEELKEVKKPGFIKRAAIKVKDAIATGARKVVENCVVM